MKFISKFIFVLFSLLIILNTSSCKGLVEDIGDMSKFRDSLQTVFPDEDINVNISNGSYLSVSFVNSELKQLTKDEKNKIAKNVGNISRHFFKKERILEGVLIFMIHKNYVVYKYSESLDVHELYETDSIPESDSLTTD